MNNSSIERSHAVLNITKRCNQRCIFCFEGSRRDWKEPSFDEIRHIVSKIDVRCNEVILMGAEALLRSDILEVIQFIRKKVKKLAVFTNGHVLSRAGFVEKLAEAGLDTLLVSFHYADAESFANGTRSNKNKYKRLIQGLRNVRDYNEKKKANELFITPEVMLFRYNLGRLEEIVKILEDSLGERFRHLNISRILPTDLALEHNLIVPVREAKEELLTVLAKYGQRRELGLTRIPLCMIPEWEHHAIELKYRIFSVYVEANFKNKKQMTPMQDIVEEFSHNPFKRVCKGCTLLSLCPTNVAFAAKREHIPIPSRVSIAEIVSRLNVNFKLECQL